MNVDQKTYTLLQNNEYQTMIDAIRIIHQLPDPLVTRLGNWENLKIDDKIPDVDIQELKAWITNGNNQDHSRKVARLLLWYIFKIYLGMPQFESVVPRLSF